MEAAILICCIVIIVLLIAVLAKQFKSDDSSFLYKIKNAEEQVLKMHENSINDSTARLFDTFGRNIISSQEQQQKFSTDKLEQIREEMESLRRGNQESLEKIKEIVTEKMQSTLDEKINKAFETITNNMRELGKDLRDSQKEQEKTMEDRLEKFNSSFDSIRKEVNEMLTKIQKVSTDNIEKFRHENQESLDKFNESFNSTGKEINETLIKIQKMSADNIKEFRRENQESLEKINKIVTEKMQSTLENKISSEFKSITEHMMELGKSLSDSQSRQEKKMEERLDALNKSFGTIKNEINDRLTNIQEVNTKNIRDLRRDNQESLDKINDTVNEKLQKTLDERITQSFQTVSDRLKQVYEGLGEMKTVASGVADLKSVLSNVKTRGILGEIQLGAILGEILAPEQYGEQVQLAANSDERVDFAVKLPGANDSIWLPIDSKFPGDTFAALQRAYESGISDRIKETRKILADEIKRCAKDISKKYIQIPYTTNFAIMFLPFEGLYAEVVNMGLIEGLQRDYKICIAGPSTMAAMLNSLRMGFNTLAIQKKTSEIEDTLRAVKTEFSKFMEVLSSAKKSLQKTESELDKLIGTRTNAINRKLRLVSTLNSEEANKILEIDEKSID